MNPENKPYLVLFAENNYIIHYFINFIRNAIKSSQNLWLDIYNLLDIFGGLEVAC